MSSESTMPYSLYDFAKQTARSLRRNQTDSEKKLWERLRNRQFLGKKFLRQYPIVFDYESHKRFFIADFYCHEAHLVVELDGKSHDSTKDYDELRTFIINSLGINVIRFKNEQVENGIETVLTRLSALLRE